MKPKKQNITELRLLVEKRNRYRLSRPHGGQFDWWLFIFISIIVITLVIIISL